MDPTSALKTHKCDGCGLSFTRKYNLKRHIENIHGQEDSMADEMNDTEPKVKRQRVYEAHDDSDEYGSDSEDPEAETDDDDESSHSVEKSEPESEDKSESSSNGEESETETDYDEESGLSSEVSEPETDDENETSSNSEESEAETDDGPDDIDESTSDLEDNHTFNDWLQEAKDSIHEMWNTKFEKYTNEGMSEDDAKTKADTRTMWALKKGFFERYKNFLASFLLIKDNDTHRQIVDDLEEKLDKGLDVNTALNRIIPKYHGQFEGLFERLHEGESEEEDSESED